MIKREENFSSQKPSDFSDIEDSSLRDYNRGAVLANFFEDYYKDISSDAVSYKKFLDTIDWYLEFCSIPEKDRAKHQMRVHLFQRGYVYGS